MHNFLYNMMLLAETNRFKNMGNRFRGHRAEFDSQDILIGVLILVGAAIGIFVLSRFLSRQDRRRAFNSPRALFRELCKAHALDRPSRKLLKQVARYQRLTQPARLFLEPDRFDPANLSPQLVARLEEVQMVRDRIFAKTLDEAGSAARGKSASTGKRKASAASRKSAPAKKPPADKSPKLATPSEA